MAKRWQPWRDLRGREHLVVGFHHRAEVAGGAVYGRRADGRAAIVLAPSLDRVQRRVALGHELVHDERGILSDDATPATMQREEETVRRVAARRFVPLDELLEFVTRRSEVEPVDARLVAVEFDVTNEVASEALRQLNEQLLARELRRVARPS